MSKRVCYTVFQGSICGGFNETLKSVDRRIDLSPLVARVNEGVLRIDRCFVKVVGRINPGVDAFTVIVNGNQVLEESDPWWFGAKDKLINREVDIDFSAIRYQPNVEVTISIQKPAWILCACFTGTIDLCFDVEIVRKPLVGSPIPTPGSEVAQAAKWIIGAAAGVAAFGVMYALVSRYGGKGGAR